ncbi:hypothetical protein AGMMS50256_13700 [Betaproteobacteria bacterium]|nr:hypothetical protein AGMMS50256_13700 [Betaproteobacteria bacterium]
MDNYEKYMNDPDIVDEPTALREIHAIRLMLHDKTKNMTPEERAALTRSDAQEMIDKYGLNVKRRTPQEMLDAV